MNDLTDLETNRARMVEAHLFRRGVTNPAVLDAFRQVPRERFVPAELAECHQFDALIWFDETHAVRPLERTPRRGADLPETYPFGL